MGGWNDRPIQRHCERTFRARYAEAARAVSTGEKQGCGSGSCCATDHDAAKFGEALYDADQRAGLPAGAATASLGCGNPTAVAELREGETVLDLGSGGGIDVLLSARRVGPTGVVYGLDMTEEMLALAQRNKAEAGATNVHFLRGEIENIPLPAESVDVVISNCVINLSTDKSQVLREIARVLRPGGRVGVSDVVAEDRLSPEERAERGAWVGCIAGALSVSEYVDRPRGGRARGCRGDLHARGRRRHARGDRAGGQAGVRCAASCRSSVPRQAMRLLSLGRRRPLLGSGQPLEEEAADEDEATDDDERERAGDGVERAEVVEEDLGEAEAEERQPAVAQQA